MGIYVQELIYQIPVVFSGVWLNSKQSHLQICEHQDFLIINFPTLIDQEYVAEQIKTSLPENLWPNESNISFIKGMDDNIVQLITCELSQNGDLVLFSIPIDKNFSGMGMGGFYSFSLKYLRNQKV